CRILNVGCGPAQEIQYLLQEAPPGRDYDVTLVDFDEETLDYARARLGDLNLRFGHRIEIKTRRVSAMQLLRRRYSAERNPLEANYDLIYCTGLFDYL